MLVDLGLSPSIKEVSSCKLVLTELSKLAEIDFIGNVTDLERSFETPRPGNVFLDGINLGAVLWCVSFFEEGWLAVFFELKTNIVWKHRMDGDMPPYGLILLQV